MKVTIHDAEVLRSLGSLEVAAYLRSHGWRQTQRIGDKGAVWITPSSSGEEFEILLPLDRHLRDYVPRMAEVLQILEVAESRSQPEILRDVTLSTSDVIRVRLEHGVVEGGAIPLEYGVRLVEETREIMLASACAAIRPKAMYQSRKPARAMEYMSGLRMGQTEQGSFVLTIRSNVPPRLLSSRPANLFPEMAESVVDEPFERQVTLTFANALSAARDAVTQAGATGDLSPFVEAVDSGVSANLCAALAGLGMDTPTQDVTLGINWSPTRAVPEKTPSRFLFTADAFPILREAARLLREDIPQEDFELYGVVLAVRREEGAPTGRVTIRGYVDGSLRQVRVDMNEENYEAAIEAHRKGLPVQCEGELIREGRTFLLRNARNFTAEEE
ncbi:MAG: hypothetical protein JWL77_3458 [Chthonomonadaceae bacterium]|nr:hypothetical protein [Chthonomonadaceae bacterium]